MPRLGVRVPLSPPSLLFLRCSQTARFVSVIPIFIANNCINNLLWAALTILSNIHNSLVFPCNVWEYLWEQMRWRARLEAIRGEHEVTLRPWALFRRRGSLARLGERVGFSALLSMGDGGISVWAGIRLYPSLRRGSDRPTTGPQSPRRGPSSGRSSRR